MYQGHYGGMPYYNQHKGMYGNQGYGPYGGQGYDRFGAREYDSFGRGAYGGQQGQGQTQAGVSSQGPVVPQHGNQQNQPAQDEPQTSEGAAASSVPQPNTQGQNQGYQGYQSGAGAGRYGNYAPSSSSHPQYYPQSQHGGYGAQQQSGGYQGTPQNQPGQGQPQTGRQQQQGGWNQFSH